MTEKGKGGYYVEYAPTGRATCRCGSAIGANTVRVGVETKSAFFDGYEIKWNHPRCVCVSSMLNLKGWEYLKWRDQESLRTRFGPKVPDSDAELMKRREDETTKVWRVRDLLGKHLTPHGVREMLEANSVRTEKLSNSLQLHMAADGLLWGKTGPCPECKGPNVAYTTVEFRCEGWLSGFTRCTWSGQSVPRYRWRVPRDVREAMPAELTELVKELGEQPAEEQPVFKGPDGNDIAPAWTVDDEEDPEGDEDEPPAGRELYGISIGVASDRKELEELVEQHGGELVEDAGEADVFVVSEAAVQEGKRKWLKRLQQAHTKKVPFVSPEWLRRLAARSEGWAKLRKLSGCAEFVVDKGPAVDTGSDEYWGRKYFQAKVDKLEKAEREAEEAANAKRRRPAKRPEPKPGSDILVVDPAYGRSADVHVTFDDDYGYTAYHAMLNVADSSTGVNKFYRMQARGPEPLGGGPSSLTTAQVLKPQGGKTFTFWIHWGRTGTYGQGDTRSYNGLGEQGAIERFREKFHDCTGVDWDDRQWFEKQPGKYFMVDLDDGNEAAADLAEIEARREAKRAKVDPSAAAAAAPKDEAEVLDERVRSFVQLIFDPDMMKRQLEEMEVDIKKMPLGKISKTQIQTAYGILNQASEAVTAGSAARVRDCTNKFFTLIPHNFGHRAPPLLDTAEAIKKKLDLLDALCGIEEANAIMEASDKEGDKTLSNYRSLKTDITPVDKGSDLYKMLESYAADSQDPSHFSKFAVHDILAIRRDGETERFEPWKENPNRQLLWHGSRLTNWVGILSSGLRIAPPEAPASGYRFGKGIYFADCASKSASYCCSGTEAVLILNEVAVGVPFETPNDMYMEKAQPGSDSTWALGMTVPDPAQTITIENGIKVPKGRPVSANRHTSCSHDEIIVYNVAQVRIRYLLRVRFN
eukprot:m51a1_g2547 hypothetical protein (922) ;mRNA; f:294859-298552